MRIGIDADPVGRDRSGNEVYLRGIVGGLQRVAGTGDELVLFGSVPDALRELAAGTTQVAGVRAGLLGELALGRAMTRAGVDVAVGHYNPPFRFRGRLATVVHDIAYQRVPDAYPRLLRLRIGWSVSRAVRASDLVVTVSDFSRAELLDAFPRLAPERVIVTYDAPADVYLHPVSPDALDAVRHRYGVPDRFVLAVGNLQPRKNLRRLAAAVERVGVPLVVVGQRLWHANRVLADLGPNVRWLGYVPDADLAALYRLCAVFAYPSLYEGFGLPVVEAMACGAPVVTSATTALREVAGDAAVLVDPKSVDDIASAISSLLGSEDLASGLATRGQARARAFSWDDSARVLLDALRGL